MHFNCYSSQICQSDVLTTSINNSTHNILPQEPTRVIELCTKNNNFSLQIFFILILETFEN